MKLHEYVLIEENKGIIGTAICEYGTFRRLRQKYNKNNKSMGIVLISKSLLGNPGRKELRKFKVNQ